MTRPPMAGAAAAELVDEFTREALVMRTERSITADQTVAGLEAFVAARGRAPQFFGCDNESELTSYARSETCVGSPRRRPRTSSAARHGKTRSWSPFLSQPCARRAARRRGVLLPGRSTGPHRRLTAGLQPASLAFRAGDAHPGRVRRLLRTRVTGGSQAPRGTEARRLSQSMDGHNGVRPRRREHPHGTRSRRPWMLSMLGIRSNRRFGGSRCRRVRPTGVG
jgi:hypothetical protein